jgi:hypothetical protein
MPKHRVSLIPLARNYIIVNDALNCRPYNPNTYFYYLL